jgi:hypothetical protein
MVASGSPIPRARNSSGFRVDRFYSFYEDRLSWLAKAISGTESRPTFAQETVRWTWRLFPFASDPQSALLADKTVQVLKKLPNTKKDALLASPSWLKKTAASNTTR